MTQVKETDVLVIGGGTSGVAAGIQSARLGVKTLIIEETPWLGGMITAAGVSAFDGNKYALGGGIFGELRKKIEDHYGGADKTFTGWISLTCFEPKVGKMFLHQLADEEKNLDIWFETCMISVTRENDKVIGAFVRTKDGSDIEVRAKVVIEATEFGQVLAKGKIPYRLGRDANSDTKEPDAPEIPDDQIQDITYCAILKKYDGEAPKVKAPDDYDPSKFKCSVKMDCDVTDETTLNYKLHDWESFINYAALPNDKYLLNWPFKANDYLTTRDIYENPSSRPYHFARAKELALAYVHYIQTTLGHPEWGLATDEFQTKDSLPYIPYVRESRRVKGVKLMVEGDVVPAKDSFRPRLIEDSIAVGDYFLDHHHSTFFNTGKDKFEEKLPANAPFQISYYTLIPEEIDGVIVAEKSISVTHIVNGCTRLQPVVMLIGQAAGAAAAISVKHDVLPRDINIIELQDILINAGCQLFPYADIYNNLPEFKSIQKLALMKIFVDAIDFKFNSNEIISDNEIELISGKIDIDKDSLKGLTRGNAYQRIYEMLK